MSVLRASSLLLLAACTAGPEPVTPVQEDPLEFDLEVVGPDPAAVEAYQAGLLARDEVAAVLGPHQRLLSFELEREAEGEGPELPTTRFVAIAYDYDADQAWELRGDIASEAPVAVSQTDARPVPSVGEFQEAVELLLASDPDLAARVAAGELAVFRAMPPLLSDLDGDATHRILSVGVSEVETVETREILGADLSAARLIHYDGAAPPDSQGGGGVCNPPPAAWQNGVSRGTPGWARLRIRAGGQELWSMVVIRPSSSSGENGSGVELIDVRYKGERVLRQAHLPVLNVKYVNDTCGPYRDWQFEENPFVADGTDVAPGIRVATNVETMMDNGTDTGNFLGVAVYGDKDEVIMKSELAAGWYRYVSEWRFQRDGSIQPRFGFDAVENACTCNRHTHHGYWRLDFGIGDEDNRFEEYSAATGWRLVETEEIRLKDYVDQRRWRVTDTETGRGYEITPSLVDGNPTAFGKGDVWMLRQRRSERDDADERQWWETEAAIDAFADGESVVDEDLVLWYGGHFIHDDSDPTTNASHIVGPTLTPVGW